jgi:hypothetical protein
MPITAEPGREIWEAGLPVGPFLTVSFQRYRRPARDFLDLPPRSWGALPIGRGRDGDLLLPLGEDEAFWLGLSSKENAPLILVCVTSGATLDGITGASAAKTPSQSALSGVLVPPARSVEGIARADGGWWPFVSSTSTSNIPATRAISIFAIPSIQPHRAIGSAQRRGIGPLHEPEAGSQPRYSARAKRASAEGWNLKQTAGVQIRVVSPGAFFAATGVRLAAFDEAASYRGWRLP